MRHPIMSLLSKFCSGVTLAAILVALSPASAYAQIDTSFAGFPEINVFRPGVQTFDVLTSDVIPDMLRPKWTRAMTDVGGWPSMFRFKDNIFLEFNQRDAHKGIGGWVPEATGDLLRYISPDEGNTWVALPSMDKSRFQAEYVVRGDTLYRYEWEGTRKITQVSTSTDGVTFSPRQDVYNAPYTFWGVIYDETTDTFWAPPHAITSGSARQVHLLKSKDGFNWEKTAVIQGPNALLESETAIHIKDDGTMVALIRQKSSGGLYSQRVSQPPYTDWELIDRGETNLEGHHFFEIGGETFVTSRGFLPTSSELVTDELRANSDMLYSSARIPYSQIYKYDNETDELIPWAVLDSMGDNSYPFLVETPTEVLVAYYSQQQDAVSKTYLAAFDKDIFLGGFAALAANVPEPGTFILLATGLVPFVAVWRARRRKQHMAR